MNCEQIYHGQKKTFDYVVRSYSIESIPYIRIEINSEFGCKSDMAIHSNKFNIKQLITKNRNRDTISGRSY